MLYGKHLFTSSHCILVAQPFATSEGTLYTTYCRFSRTDVPCSQYKDPRHVDAIDPQWNLFDFTPEGRGTDWYPELSYS